MRTSLIIKKPEDDRPTLLRDVELALHGGHGVVFSYLSDSRREIFRLQSEDGSPISVIIRGEWVVFEAIMQTDGWADLKRGDRCMVAYDMSRAHSPQTIFEALNGAREEAAVV